MSEANYREIKVPPLGESVSEATVARWMKHHGDTVKADEIIVELETDKVTLEVTSPASGILHAIHANTGDLVHHGTVLGTVHLSGEASHHAPAAAAPAPAAHHLEHHTPAYTPPPAHYPASPHHAAPPTHYPAAPHHAAPEQHSHAEHHGHREELSPAVLRLVAENNLDISLIPASGVDGRLTKEDVVHYLEHHHKPHHHQHAQPAPVVYHEEKAVPHHPPAPQHQTTHEHKHVHSRQSDRREERVKMSQLRRKIAERLKHAQNTAAILTTFNEIDMTAVNQMRAHYKDAFEKKHGVKLGFMSFFVKAAVQALKEFPAVNAEIHGDEIIYKNFYDIGVAVSAPHGLVVPVVRNAEHMSYAEIEKAIFHLGQRARDGKLSREDMEGGTFTVSNGGIFGSLMSTPILNPPQTGILGMHKVQERPVAIQGKIEIRPMMYIALSYDHRLIDGREAVTFLVRVKENIENPERLLLEV